MKPIAKLVDLNDPRPPDSVNIKIDPRVPPLPRHKAGGETTVDQKSAGDGADLALAQQLLQLKQNVTRTLVAASPEFRILQELRDSGLSNCTKCVGEIEVRLTDDNDPGQSRSTSSANVPAWRRRTWRLAPTH